MTAAVDADAQRDALVERLTQAVAGMFHLYTTYLGDRLGLYAALAATGACTSNELARRTETVERYVREWLEQQAVIGILDVDDPSAPASERRYQLPIGHAEVLVQRDNINYFAPLAQLMVGTVRPISMVLDAFRTGGGVPFGEFGSDMRDGQAGLNRNAFLQLLGKEWLPQVPDVHARLESNPPARVAEIGCGGGWASIGLALAYPLVRVDGFDVDAPSIALAEANAREMGVAGRVRFGVHNASQIEALGKYDLVLAFECIHDMADPIGALEAMRRIAGPGGSVIVMDERVGESFAERNDATEWFMYGFSVLHCLPACMAEQPSAATGTVMRPGTLRHYARRAGFRDLEVLPIDNYFYFFYRLLQ